MLFHADIPLTWSPGGSVQKCALPLFLSNQERERTNNIIIILNFWMID